MANAASNLSFWGPPADYFVELIGTSDAVDKFIQTASRNGRISQKSLCQAIADEYAFSWVDGYEELPAEHELKIQDWPSGERSVSWHCYGYHSDEQSDMKALSAKFPTLDVLITAQLDDYEADTSYFWEGRSFGYLATSAHQKLELLSLTCLTHEYRLTERDLQARLLQFLESWDAGILHMTNEELLETFSDPDMEDLEGLDRELHDCFLVAGLLNHTEDSFVSGLPETLVSKVKTTETILNCILSADQEDIIHTNYHKDEYLRSKAEKFLLRMTPVIAVSATEGQYIKPRKALSL